MAQTGYIFIRNGTPIPENNEYYRLNGEMKKAEKTGIRPLHASIYMKWEDYIRPSSDPVCIEMEDYFGNLKIRIDANDDGIMTVAFPNAEIIETEDGPMMGFRCDVNAAMWIGGAIVSAAFEYATGGGEEDDDE